jgi:hypothetical protein
MRPASVTTPGGVATSAWLPLDPYTDADLVGLFTYLSGAATYDVQMTPDDVFNPTVVPVAYPVGIAAMAGASANQAAALGVPCKAVRINQTAGAGTVRLTAVVSGSQ